MYSCTESLPNSPDLRDDNEQICPIDEPDSAQMVDDTLPSPKKSIGHTLPSPSKDYTDHTLPSPSDDSTDHTLPSPTKDSSNHTVPSPSKESIEENTDVSIDEGIKSLPLPTALEKEIKIQKGSKSLGKLSHLIPRTNSMLYFESIFR